MKYLKNKNGQALIEAVLIMNIILLLFFAMIVFSVYIYDKMVVVFAANLAIDQAIGKIPEPGMTRTKIEGLMKQSGYGALGLGVFLQGQNVVANVIRNNNKGEINVSVSATYSIHIPLVSEFLNNNVISHTSKVDYSW